MLLLGHACWAYVTGRITAKSFGSQPNVFLLLILGMLPDIDLVLGVLNLQHRTLTHSIIFWAILFAPIFARFRWIALPYFVAVTQHIFFGDLVVGRTAIFWPLELRLGLGLPVLSPINLTLEGAGLALFFVFALRSKDLTSNASTLWRILAVAPLLAFVALASFSDYVLPLFLEGIDARHLERNLPLILANPNLQVAVLLHLALVVAILASFPLTSKKKIGARQS